MKQNIRQVRDVGGTLVNGVVQMLYEVTKVKHLFRYSSSQYLSLEILAVHISDPHARWGPHASWKIAPAFLTMNNFSPQFFIRPQHLIIEITRTENMVCTCSFLFNFSKMIIELNKTHLLSLYLKCNVDKVSQYWKMFHVPLSLRVFRKNSYFLGRRIWSMDFYLFGPSLFQKKDFMELTHKGMILKKRGNFEWLHLIWGVFICFGRGIRTERLPEVACRPAGPCQGAGIGLSNSQPCTFRE